MKLFDLHCDTITGLETVQLDLGSCEAAIDLNKIEKSGFDAYAQCFAMFLSDEYRGEKALRQWDAEYAWFCRQMVLYSDVIEQVKTADDLRRITESGKTAAMADVLRHIEHILKLGGENVIALGSDFDGAKAPQDFDSVEKMPNLYAFLRDHLGTALTDRIFYGNAADFLCRNFPKGNEKRKEKGNGCKS